MIRLIGDLLITTKHLKQKSAGAFTSALFDFAFWKFLQTVKVSS